jgi:hypothetical protein
VIRIAFANVFRGLEADRAEWLRITSNALDDVQSASGLASRSF